MRPFYDIGIRLYWFIALLISIWNRKARLWINGRKHWYEKLESALDGNQKLIWFHCASLGEFEQGRPLIEGIRERQPDHRILLTFFSPSGLRKERIIKAQIMLCTFPWIPGKMPGNCLICFPLRRPYLLNTNSGIIFFIS